MLDHLYVNLLISSHSFLRLGRHIKCGLLTPKIIISSFFFGTFDRSTNGMSRGRMAIFQDLCNRQLLANGSFKAFSFPFWSKYKLVSSQNSKWIIKKIPLKCSIIILSLLANKSWYLVCYFCLENLCIIVCWYTGLGLGPDLTTYSFYNLIPCIRNLIFCVVISFFFHLSYFALICFLWFCLLFFGNGLTFLLI